jgi:hypothetical protein
MPRSRLANLLVAAAAGAVFLAALFTDGLLSALLLVAVAGFLVLLSAAAWPTIPGRGRLVRILVVLLVLVLAAVKLAKA